MLRIEYCEGWKLLEKTYECSRKESLIAVYGCFYSSISDLPEANPDSVITLVEMRMRLRIDDKPHANRTNILSPRRRSVYLTREFLKPRSV
jgi:hypothetical protein